MVRRVDDAAILASLDIVWLSVPAIHRRLGYVGLAHELSASLRRLAAAGLIEVTGRPTEAKKLREPGRKYTIHCYRRKDPGA